MKFLYTVKRTATAEVLDRYAQLGASAFRVNFGRGSLEENAQCVERIAQREGVEAFLDLPGCKPRLGAYPNGREAYATGEAILLEDGAACSHAVCSLCNDRRGLCDRGCHRRKLGAETARARADAKGLGAHGAERRGPVQLLRILQHRPAPEAHGAERAGAADRRAPATEGVQLPRGELRLL